MRTISLRKGFAAATVDEISATAGVTKGSFYHHFDSKEALGLATLQVYFDGIIAALEDGAWTSEPDPRRRLLAFLDHVVDVFSGPLLVHGCLLGMIALEQSGESSVFQADVGAKFDQLHDAVVPLFQAVARALPRGIIAADLTDQLLATIEGAVVLAKAHRTPDASARQLRSFRRGIEALITSTDPADQGAP